MKSLRSKCLNPAKHKSGFLMAFLQTMEFSRSVGIMLS